MIEISVAVCYDGFEHRVVTMESRSHQKAVPPQGKKARLGKLIGSKPDSSGDECINDREGTKSPVKALNATSIANMICFKSVRVTRAKDSSHHTVCSSVTN